MCPKLVIGSSITENATTKPRGQDLVFCLFCWLKTVCNLRRQQGVINIDYLLCKPTVIKAKLSVTVTAELRV